MQLGLFILKDALKLEKLPESAEELELPKHFSVSGYKKKIDKFFEQHRDEYIVEETKKIHPSFKTHIQELSSSIIVEEEEEEDSKSGAKNKKSHAKGAAAKQVKATKTKPVLDTVKVFELLSIHTINIYTENLVTFLQELEDIVSFFCFAVFY